MRTETYQKQPNGTTALAKITEKEAKMTEELVLRFDHLRRDLLGVVAAWDKRGPEELQDIPTIKQELGEMLPELRKLVANLEGLQRQMGA